MGERRDRRRPLVSMNCDLSPIPFGFSLCRLQRGSSIVKGVPSLKTLADLSLSGQFLITSLPILVFVMLVIGTLVSREVVNGVVNRLGGVTGLYVQSFVAPHAQALLHADDLDESDREAMGNLLRTTPLGKRIVAFKVWRPDGRVLYSKSPEMIGRKYPIEEGLATALDGGTYSKISTLTSDENEFEVRNWSRLIETYVPIHGDGTGKVIAVAEFYQTTDEIENEAWVARRNSWCIVAITVLTMYLLLFGLVRRGSRTIDRQRLELKDRVVQLSTLLVQNVALHEKVRRAAVHSTTANEQILRQISADLHDGPGQDMGLALMRFEALADKCRSCSRGNGAGGGVDTILLSLRSALADLRAISAGLRLPDIDQLPIADVARRAVRDHERKSGARVTQRIEEVDAEDTLPVKIALYRMLQEALSNGFRHAGGSGQQVEVKKVGDQLKIRVIDTGPGFDPAVASKCGGQGLVGMRERAEIHGGSFEVTSSPNQGTVICISLPLIVTETKNV
jgi:signal transduction histidine kinase